MAEKSQKREVVVFGAKEHVEERDIGRGKSVKEGQCRASDVGE